MRNLAHDDKRSQANIVSFPKKDEHQAMSSKLEGGYTKLPNHLIDDHVMANLNDKAFKCLTLIIRQTIGFDRTSYALSFAQFQKLCGIKKRETVIAALKELETVKLIKITRKLGCINEYQCTLNQYQPSALVPKKKTSTTKQDGTSTTKQDKTSTDKGDSNKENIKEKIKEQKKEHFSVDNFESDLFSSSITYKHDDNKTYTLRELASVYTVQADFAVHAKQRCPMLSDQQIMDELKNFAQWSTTREKQTAQAWMNAWIYRLDKLKSSKPSAKRKTLSDLQIATFAAKLANHHEFGQKFAKKGEQAKAFQLRIEQGLRDSKQRKAWAEYLTAVGFKGDLS